MEDFERQLVSSTKYYFADYPEGVPVEFLSKIKELNNTKIANQGVSEDQRTPFYFLVDFNSPDTSIAKELVDFLEQIIQKGLKLTAGSYQVVNVQDFTRQVAQECSRLLVVFGAQSLQKLAIRREFDQVRNQIIPRERFDLLITDSLSEMKDSPELKKQFWEVLKRYA